jgi:hypothetical protein
MGKSTTAIKENVRKDKEKEEGSNDIAPFFFLGRTEAL